MPSFSTPSSRWAAIQSRNPLAASAFLYSVTTTKIYCRPTCPSRLARRANIVFHDTATEAESDGFRPCKRCRPEMNDIEGSPQKLFVEQACVLIGKEGGRGEKWSVKALAKEVGLTESHFCRVFKKITGMTVGEYRKRVCPGIPGIVEGISEGAREPATPMTKQSIPVLSGSYVISNTETSSTKKLPKFEPVNMTSDYYDFDTFLDTMGLDGTDFETQFLQLPVYQPFHQSTNTTSDNDDLINFDF